MEYQYIMFMITIQTPFLYLIWRLFQKEQQEQRLTLRKIKKQNEHITRFIDTLKMSLEKVSEDLYGSGTINTRFNELEKKTSNFQAKLEDMELYTGLNNINTKESTPSPILKDKSFI